MPTWLVVAYLEISIFLVAEIWRVVGNMANFKMLLSCLLPVVLFGPLRAAEPPEIGDVAPTWEKLAGVDGRQHSSKDLTGAEAVVVCFTCNSCPYAVDYEDRLIALQKKYSSSAGKVRIVAINSNTVPADRMEKMKERAEQKQFNFPYVWDETQDVAKAFGAIYTPEFFVLNKDRRIIYRGAMDDSTKAEDVKVCYVELAIEAALQGKVPEVQSTGARGCAIRFARRRR